MKTSAQADNHRSRRLSLWVRAEDKPGKSVLRHGIHLLHTEAREAGPAIGRQVAGAAGHLGLAYEAWRAKEAKAGDEFAGVGGPAAQRGPAWEAVTATTFLQGGADLLVTCYPKAVEAVRNAIGQLVGEKPTFPIQDTNLPLLQRTLAQGATR